MGNTDTKRNNIGLLRLLASMGVVILRFNSVCVNKPVVLPQFQGTLEL